MSDDYAWSFSFPKRKHYMTKQQSDVVDAKADETAQLVRNFIE
jgi:hypothetical protein